jgi:hypothetical protein
MFLSIRVVIGHDRGVSVVEIRHEEEVASWDNNENSTSGTD